MSKHLENGLMMFTTKENCTLTVKDYLYMCIKTKQTKIQQTMHQNLLCILIHILKTPTQSFSSMPP